MARRFVIKYTRPAGRAKGPKELARRSASPLPFSSDDGVEDYRALVRDIQRGMPRDEETGGEDYRTAAGVTRAPDPNGLAQKVHDALMAGYRGAAGLPSADPGPDVATRNEYRRAMGLAPLRDADDAEAVATLAALADAPAGTYRLDRERSTLTREPDGGPDYRDAAAD